MEELWDDLGSGGRGGVEHGVVGCVIFSGVLGLQGGSEDELDDGDEGGVPVMGVLGNVLAWEERSNLTLLLLLLF